MDQYEVGFIYTRCYVQKTFQLSGNCTVSPLPPLGWLAEIQSAFRILAGSGFPVSDDDFHRTTSNFAPHGHCTLVRFSSVIATSFSDAIDSTEPRAENVAGAIAVIAANPASALCAFAQGPAGNGLKFYVPPDRKIAHGTNVPGFLDALPEIEKKAQIDTKFSHLLRLFRASLREREIDNQILFQLILLEEASDDESGTFAERLRAFCERHAFAGDLAIIAQECGITLPSGKDVIDLLVKLRNAAAHNGSISEASLRQFNGDWVVPVVSDKEKLHKLVADSIRYMFCCLVGHSRDQMAKKITGPFEVRFDGDS